MAKHTAHKQELARNVIAGIGWGLGFLAVSSIFAGVGYLVRRRIEKTERVAQVSVLQRQAAAEPSARFEPGRTTPAGS